MKQIQDIKHLLSSKKYIIMIFAAMVFISCILFMSDIFSYSRSGEAAGNKLTVSRGAVQIEEPNWDKTHIDEDSNQVIPPGWEMAQRSEPGMLIPKNPYAVNDGNVALYIRLKMTVNADSFTSKNSTYDADFHYTEAERTEAVIKALRLENSDPLFGSGIIDNSNINNNNFEMYTVPDENDKTVYYFYYVGNNSGHKMKIVEPHETTEELFNYLEIPVYKKDYLGVFDQPYDIILEAEGIPVGKNSELTVNEAKTLFEN